MINARTRKNTWLICNRFCFSRILDRKSVTLQMAITGRSPGGRPLRRRRENGVVISEPAAARDRSPPGLDRSSLRRAHGHCWPSAALLRGKNETAQRPSLPYLSERIPRRVSCRGPCGAFVNIGPRRPRAIPSQPPVAGISTISRRQRPPDMRQVTRRRPTTLLVRPFLRHRLRSVELMDLGSRKISFP